MRGRWGGAERKGPALPTAGPSLPAGRGSCIRKRVPQGRFPTRPRFFLGAGVRAVSLCFGKWGLGWLPWQRGREHPPPQHPAPEDPGVGGDNRVTPPDAPTTWHCQPEMAASHPRENGPFVPGLPVLGEQARAHRRAFPRPRSSLRDSCWPLETPRGQPLASAPWQMAAPSPFLPRACQPATRGAPSPALLPEASPPSPSRRQQAAARLAGAREHLACPDRHPVLFVGDHPGNSPPQP